LNDLKLFSCSLPGSGLEKSSPGLYNSKALVGSPSPVCVSGSGDPHKGRPCPAQSRIPPGLRTLSWGQGLQSPPDCAGTVSSEITGAPWPIPQGGDHQPRSWSGSSGAVISSCQHVSESHACALRRSCSDRGGFSQLPPRARTTIISTIFKKLFTASIPPKKINYLV